MGIGSWVGRDDKVGLLLVRSLGLDKKFRSFPRLLRPGCDALNLTYELLEMDSDLLVVDCANMGLEPGTTRFFHHSQAEVGTSFDSVSCHGLGMPEALSLARSLGFDRNAWFFGVQPYDLRYGTQLSPQIRVSYSQILSSLKQSIQDLENDQNC